MRLLLAFLFVTPFQVGFAQNLFKTSEGKIDFVSDAPLELIKAQSPKLVGLLNITDRTFAFTISMRSFDGFNSPLQKTHFNENYMESDKFPDATFEGKIIEDIDFSKPGKYDVRCKGKFTVHGITQMRIIKCQLTISENNIKAYSKFTVLLEEHNIKIPSVVSQKIADEITVEMYTSLTLKK